MKPLARGEGAWWARGRGALRVSGTGGIRTGVRDTGLGGGVLTPSSPRESCRPGRIRELSTCVTTPRYIWTRRTGREKLCGRFARTRRRNLLASQGPSMGPPRTPVAGQGLCLGPRLPSFRPSRCTDTVRLHLY